MNNFNLLRLFASSQVMIIHTIVHMNDKIYFLEKLKQILYFVPGVPIFFFLSGYLILMSYEKNSNLKVYFFNRILRIYPALYMNLVISIAILFFFGFIYIDVGFIKWIIAQLSFFQFYNIDMFRPFGTGVINGSLWTISVELSFYLLVPFLSFLFNKSYIYIFILILFSFIFAFADSFYLRTELHQKLLHVSILPYLHFFLVGMLFYKERTRIKGIIENKFMYWLLFYVLYIVIIDLLNYESYLFSLIRWALLSFVIFSFAFSFKFLRFKILINNDFTYGIYIYHMLIINIFVYLKINDSYIYFFTIILFSLLSGVLSWYLIEKPSLKLKKQSIFNKLQQL